MESKQSAVEWFFSELERMQYFIGNDMLESFDQAKAMEKEQIENAWYAGDEDGAIHEFEQYYNETYGN